MTRPDETGRPHREAADDPVATGLPAVKEALAAAEAADSSASGRPTAADSRALPGAGATASTIHRAASPAQDTAERPIARGDIRVVKPLPWLEGSTRLAVVRRVDAERDAVGRRVDAERDAVEMMLAHPWPELATDTDAVIASDDSGLPYPLVVECYVRGPVWMRQLRERVGALPESLLQAIGDVVVDRDRTVEGVYAGPPLAGPTDPRWHFKEDEVAEWATLTDDCTGALLDGDDSTTIEPERIDPHTYGGASDPTSVHQIHPHLEETVHILSTRRVAVEFQDLDPEALNPDRWVECLGRNSGMTAFAAVQPTLDRTLSAAGAQVLERAA